MHTEKVFNKLPFLRNLDGIDRQGDDCMTDDYDQNEEAITDGHALASDNRGVEEAIEDYGDEDDMQKDGAATDESCEESEERDQ